MGPGVVLLSIFEIMHIVTTNKNMFTPDSWRPNRKEELMYFAAVLKVAACGHCREVTWHKVQAVFFIPLSWYMQPETAVYDTGCPGLPYLGGSLLPESRQPIHAGKSDCRWKCLPNLARIGWMKLLLNNVVDSGGSCAVQRRRIRAWPAPVALARRGSYVFFLCIWWVQPSREAHEDAPAIPTHGVINQFLERPSRKMISPPRPGDGGDTDGECHNICSRVNLHPASQGCH